MSVEHGGASPPAPAADGGEVSLPGGVRATLLELSFVTPQGVRTTCAAAAGTSVMLVALLNGIDGVLAECGGSLACGACHVYVEPSQQPLLQPPGEAELALLDLTASERRVNSRLSCQITVSERLDGLVVHLPPAQL